MKHKTSQGESLPDNLTMLDDLIQRCYEDLLQTIGENAKLGDFIKMIELRRKLAPNDSEQRRFWRMLEKVRRETLGSSRKDKPAKTHDEGSAR